MYLPNGRNDLRAVASLLLISIIGANLGTAPAWSAGESQPRSSSKTAAKSSAPTAKGGAGAQSSGIASARALMAKGQYKAALVQLEDAVQKNQANSAECHYLAGEAYFKTGNLKLARQHLRLAVRLGRGSVYAQKANVALMKLPKDLVGPRTGPDTRLLASLFGISKQRGAGQPSRPTIIDFYATWCTPCKEMEKVISKVKQEYGDKITIMRVDVDDPKNDQLIDQYEVSPIPTVVFLNSDGEVVTYSVGYSGEANVNDGIKKILAAI